MLRGKGKGGVKVVGWLLHGLRGVWLLLYSLMRGGWGVGGLEEVMGWWVECEGVGVCDLLLLVLLESVAVHLSREVVECCCEVCYFVGECGVLFCCFC